MSKDHNQTFLGESIKKWLEQHHLADKMSEMRLRTEMVNLLGPLSKHATKMYLKKGVYHIKVDSAPLRHELSMAKEKMRVDLNNALGREVVKQILIY